MICFIFFLGYRRVFQPIGVSTNWCQSSPTGTNIIRFFFLKIVYYLKIGFFNQWTIYHIQRSPCIQTYELFSHSAQILFDEQERQALKKLENIRNDHSQRLTQLQKDQLEDRRKGELIEMNSNLVDKALMMIRSAIANQVFFILCWCCYFKEFKLPVLLCYRVN